MKWAYLSLVLGTIIGCTETPEPAKPKAKPKPRYQIVEIPKQADERPVVNLPKKLRVQNYGRSRNEGSCAFASTINLCVWLQQPDLATALHKQYGAANSDRIRTVLTQLGANFAMTTRGDVAFLDRCVKLRRGAAIHYFDEHMVVLVHLDKDWAGLLDVNETDSIIYIPRATFINNWKYQYSGWAFTILDGSPPPPLPWMPRTKMVIPNTRSKFDRM